MIGNFQDGRTPGKMQYGSGWWFLDQQDGMERQLDALSNLGLLEPIRGHAHRQPLIPLLHPARIFPPHSLQSAGHEISQGLLPDDVALVGSMVRDICYHNAAAYFGFELPANCM